MSILPTEPKVYHITHGINLAQIIADGYLWSDQEILSRGGPKTTVGISHIKKRRLEELQVSCHPGTTVGQYVPFNFCPRSVMLFILHKQNHPDLDYKDGQRPILHLEVDFQEAIQWANGQDRRWAFTDRNAGCEFFHSYSEPLDLAKLAWDHIAATDFRERDVKESKQAEFLIFESVPWSLIRKIGVINERFADRVREIVSRSDHQPVITAEPSWYFRENGLSEREAR